MFVILESQFSILILSFKKRMSSFLVILLSVLTGFGLAFIFAHTVLVATKGPSYTDSNTGIEIPLQDPQSNLTITTSQLLQPEVLSPSSIYINDWTVQGFTGLAWIVTLLGTLWYA